MVLVTRDLSGLAEGITGAGSALSTALGQRVQTQQKEDLRQKIRGEEEEDLKKKSRLQFEQTQKYGSILKETIASLGPNPSSIQVVSALNKAIEAGVPLDYVKAEHSFMESQMKSSLESQREKEYMQGMGIPQGASPGAPAVPPPSGEQPQFEQPQIQRDLPQFLQSPTQQQGLPQFLQPEQQPDVPQFLEPQPQQQAQQPQEPVAQPQIAPQKSIFGDMTEDQLVATQAAPTERIRRGGAAELEKRKLDHSRFAADRTFHAKGAQKSRDEFNALRRSLRGKESALMTSKIAIESGETGPISWANVSKKLDLPELMNSAGTMLSQSGKTFFFGNMEKVSAKAQNQWLEQRIASLASEVGDPLYSALTKNAMLAGELALDKAYTEAYQRIAKQDMIDFGYERNDIEDRAYEATENIHRNILTETSYKTRELYEEEKGDKWILDHAGDKVTPGTQLTKNTLGALVHKYKGDMSKAVRNAKKLGYSISQVENIKRWTRYKDEGE
ncbi:MAG: hypothetical protein K1000chlam2_00008 [Chlamydiae bacterium]|nr:hypothetical protein [Chlamydiota bacterium]